MKRFLSLTCFIFIMGFPVMNLNAQDSGSNLAYPSFQALLSLNMGYAHNADMDDWAEARGDALADYYNSVTGTSDFDSENSTGKFTYGIDAELRFFSDALGFGAGSGYNMCKSEAKVTGSGWVDEGTYTLTLGVVPVIGTVYYRSAIDNNSFLLFGAGIGYYMASMNAKYDDKDTINTTTGYDYDFDTSTIGYHLKCEYDLILGNFFLSAGVLARYVEFDKFKDNGVTIIMNNGDNLGAGLTGATVYLAAGIAI